jgi:hypothetical protein
LLFLDTVETSSKEGSKIIQNLLGGEVLKDTIVDDDIRNIYALSSALTTKASILTAFNGIEALEV